MEPVPLKDLNNAETQELAELLLLQHDVRQSIEALRLWIEKEAKATSQDERIIAGALFRDAIVQFIGCFDASAPFKLSSDVIYAGVDGAQEYFKWLKDIRDAYAAHKFGRARQCVAGIMPQPDGPPTVGHLMSIYHGPADPLGAAGIIAFMNISLGHIGSRIEDLTASIKTTAAEMSAEAIAKLPNVRLHGVDPDQLRKGRGR